MLCLLPLRATSQHTYTGQITDVQHEPVGFATILNLSAGTGAIADPDGSFHLKASRGDSVMFRAVGFYSRTIVLSDFLHFNVTLRRDTITLKEVIILDLPLRMAFLNVPIEQPAFDLHQERWPILVDPTAAFLSKYPYLSPFPGVVITAFPFPPIVAVGINIDVVYQEIKMRTPKPRRAKELPVWK